MYLDFEKMLHDSSHPIDDEPRVEPKYSFLEDVIYHVILGLSVSVIVGTAFLLWILIERTKLYLAQ